ncbi:DNA-binding transcriptional LysR family regulator [Saccharopolyspora erythraea NRRL 2338]|uniref:LysR-family transcriptional regulator n=2 Tax=Saccharopolyspora erythraea TaxID=1836 RepID=A4FEV5_SACEN|nr:LysR family transcriptional regulator [Saccharopolyspora erythraea]EQD82469.1 LysR family transcriptional regulator [Saccharopolyspora erythraea D]PFG96306.1 DNA-binding transcriptional LysR family regulator [Saccharopolyspora erythraea NRRL 2338]QRK92823.1 LysR family transcriptional regulator [Saccharopolyspora erythraea]CAM02580.1 LysR-family transcriptional regulator [Saccharopolyspora erythraea NRRL 2338]
MELLRTVVSSGSVRAAAANLGYTPSAISQQLAVLEREAGIALLEKSGRGVVPTPAGRMVAERSASISAILTRTESDLAALRAGRAGRLRIRFFATAGAAIVPPAVAAFRRDHPEVRLEPCVSEDPLREVVDRDADMAIVADYGARLEAPPGVRLTHLADDPLRVVLPEGHRRAGEPVVDLAALADDEWIELQGCGGVLDRVCAPAGFTPRVAVKADDFMTAQGFVAAGLGVRLAPALGLTAANSAGVVARRLRRPEPLRRLHVAVHESVAGHGIAGEMLDLLRRSVAEPGIS